MSNCFIHPLYIMHIFVYEPYLQSFITHLHIDIYIYILYILYIMRNYAGHVLALVVGTTVHQPCSTNLPL